MCVDLGDAVDILELLFRLCGEGDVLNMYDIAMPEHGLVDSLTGHRPVIGFVIVLHRVGTGDELRRHHIGDGLESRLQRSCALLVRVVGVLVVHEGDELVFVLQIIDQRVDIDGYEGETAHDDQAGHNDGNRGEGHEAVGLDAPEALADQITASTQSHRCYSHPFLRCNSRPSRR